MAGPSIFSEPGQDLSRIGWPPDSAPHPDASLRSCSGASEGALPRAIRVRRPGWSPARRPGRDGGGSRGPDREPARSAGLRALASGYVTTLQANPSPAPVQATRLSRNTSCVSSQRTFVKLSVRSLPTVRAGQSSTGRALDSRSASAPISASQRSASMAAAQPIPAAVMA